MDQHSLRSGEVFGLVVDEDQAHAAASLNNAEAFSNPDLHPQRRAGWSAISGFHEFGLSRKLSAVVAPVEALI